MRAQQAPVSTQAPPPPSGTAAATPSRRADIQGLRAVAVILVVCFHAGLSVPGGFVGVDVFFVISGFVITNLLVAEVAATDRLDFSRFYSRRVRRILPALAITVAVVAVGAVFLLSPLGPQQQTAHTGGAASVIAANIQLYRSPVGYFDISSDHNALLHTWSLSVEEQFYLVFPALLLVCWRLSRRIGATRDRRHATAALLGIVAVGSFLLNWTLTAGNTFGGLINHPQSMAFYASPTRAWEFCAGGLIALFAAHLARIGRSVALVLGLLGGLLVGWAAFTFGAGTLFPGTAALVPVGGAALLLVAGTATDEGLSHWLGRAPMVWIGDRSYGWYLWHWPAIVFVQAIWRGQSQLVVAAGFGSLVLADLSYRLVERPARHLGGLTGRRVVPLAVVCVVVPLVICLAVAPVSDRRESSATKRLVASQDLHADEVRGCDSPTPFADRTTNCTWAVPDPKGTVVLIGDSNAGQLTEGAARAANARGYDLVVATQSSCPFVDLEVIRYGQDQPACTNFVHKSLPQLIRADPSLVILALGSSAYIPVGYVALRDPHTGQVATTAEAKAALWTKGIRAVVGRLTAAGIPTVLVHAIPSYNWAPVDCGPEAYSAPAKCGISMSRDESDAQRGLDFAAEQAAVAGMPSATAVDFADALCPDSRCSTQRGDQWMYRDGGHLSVVGSLSLTPEMASIIEAHARPG